MILSELMLSLVCSIIMILLFMLMYCLCCDGRPGGHLHGKLPLTWLPLVMSLVVTNVVLTFSPMCHGSDLGLNCNSSREFSYLVLLSQKNSRGHDFIFLARRPSCIFLSGRIRECYGECRSRLIN